MLLFHLVTVSKSTPATTPFTFSSSCIVHIFMTCNLRCYSILLQYPNQLQQQRHSPSHHHALYIFLWPVTYVVIPSCYSIQINSSYNAIHLPIIMHCTYFMTCNWRCYSILFCPHAYCRCSTLWALVQGERVLNKSSLLLSLLLSVKCCISAE